MMAGLGILMYQDHRTLNNLLEEREVSSIQKTGNPLLQHYNSKRPFFLMVLPGIIIGLGSLTLYQNQNLTVDHNLALHAFRLAYIAGGLGVFFQTSASYFRNTTYFPPSQKKSVWEWIKSYVPRVGQPTTLPQPQQVQRYSKLDEMIGP